MVSKNVVFTGKNVVQAFTEPVRPLQSNEVLVRATHSLISTGTESICLSRQFAPGSHWDRWVKYPFYPGYSMVGQVIALGDDVKGISVGERCAVRAPHKEYVTVPMHELYPVPAGVSNEDATWLALASIVQNGVRRAEHTLGESAVVVGLGLLGQLVVQYLRLLGAHQIIAIDLSEQRLTMAEEHGATSSLLMSVEEARERVLALTEGEGADVVYDVTGAASVLSNALPLLRRFGRLVLLGDTGTPAEQHLTGDVVTKGLSIVGAHDSNPPPFSTDHAYWSKQRMVALFYTYLLRGDMRVSDLVTHRFTPLEAPHAYRVLREERMTAMGVLFDWTQL